MKLFGELLVVELTTWLVKGTLVVWMSPKKTSACNTPLSFYHPNVEAQQRGTAEMAGAYASMEKEIFVG